MGERRKMGKEEEEGGGEEKEEGGYGEAAGTRCYQVWQK